jgi:hypothetical protein
MTVEYVVLGAVLIVLGVVQAWLRHGPWGKELRAEQEEVAGRRAERAKAAVEAARRAEADDGSDSDDDEAVAYPEYDAVAAKVDKRAGKAWSAWTAILGPLSMAFGIVLLVLGILGY